MTFHVVVDVRAPFQAQGAGELFDLYHIRQIWLPESQHGKRSTRAGMTAAPERHDLQRDMRQRSCALSEVPGAAGSAERPQNGLEPHSGLQNLQLGVARNGPLGSSCAAGAASGLQRGHGRGESPSNPTIRVAWSRSPHHGGRFGRCACGRGASSTAGWGLAVAGGARGSDPVVGDPVLAVNLVPDRGAADPQAAFWQTVTRVRLPAACR
jgi:hypothetical protein